MSTPRGWAAALQRTTTLSGATVEPSAGAVISGEGSQFVHANNLVLLAPGAVPSPQGAVLGCTVEVRAHERARGM